MKLFMKSGKCRVCFYVRDCTAGRVRQCRWCDTDGEPTGPVRDHRKKIGDRFRC